MQKKTKNNIFFIIKRVGSHLTDTRKQLKPPQPDRVTRDQAHKPRLTEHHKQLFESLKLSIKNGTWIDSSTFSIKIDNGTLKLNFNQSGMLNYCQITYNLPTPRTYQSQSIKLSGNDFCLSGEGSIEFSSTQHPNTSIVLFGIFKDNILKASEIYLKRDGHNYFCPEDIYPTQSLELIDHQEDHQVNLLCENNRRITIDLNKMTILSDSSYPTFQIDPENKTLIYYSDKLFKKENEKEIHYEYQISNSEYSYVTYNKLTKEIQAGKATGKYKFAEDYTFNPEKTIDELGIEFNDGYKVPIIDTCKFTKVDNLDLKKNTLKFTGKNADLRDKNIFQYDFTTGKAIGLK